MTITLILSLLVCIAGLGLVATGMVLPLLLLPTSRAAQPNHSALTGDSQVRLPP
jgi:hypothetical protein